MAISKGELRVAIQSIEYVLEARHLQILEGSAKTEADSRMDVYLPQVVAHLTAELAYSPEVATDPKTGEVIE